jgi:hypothetical protein
MVAGQKFPDFSGFKSVNESHTVTGKAIDRVLSPSELKASKAVSISDNDCQTPDFAPMDLSIMKRRSGKEYKSMSSERLK